MFVYVQKSLPPQSPTQMYAGVVSTPEFYLYKNNFPENYVVLEASYYSDVIRKHFGHFFKAVWRGGG
jgi:hypothetical protein